MKRKLPKPVKAWAYCPNGVIDTSRVYLTRTDATYYAGFNWRESVYVVDIVCRPLRRRKRRSK